MGMAALDPRTVVLAKRESLRIQRQRRVLSSLHAFTTHTFAGYQSARHIEILCEALERAIETPNSRLIVTMPPRHSKSVHVSESLPAYFLAKYPERRIIAASHTAGLAYTFSRRVRNKFDDPTWPKPSVRVADDKGAVQAWDIQGSRGGYIAVGVGGAPTGHGADLIVIDDPIRSAEDADSAVSRESLWEWYQGTLRTRLQPNGSIVLTATRWHEDDLTGRLLQASGNGGEQWEHIHMPAVDDSGDPLWPEFWTAEALDRIRRSVGSRVWEAQYQGRPVPLEGGILKAHWFNRYTVPQDHYYSLVQAWDTAFKAGEANDYTACVTLGLGVHGIDVLDVYKARLEYPDLERSLETQHMVWTSRYPGVPMTVLVEDKGSGQSLIQSIRRKPYSTIAVIAEPASRPNEKQQRVHEISPSIEAGRVRLPVQAEWLDETLHELITFPASRHDDVTDAFAIAVRRAVGIGQSNAIVSDQSVFASKAESQQARQRRVRRLQR